MPVLALLLTLALAAASCGTSEQTSTSDTTDSVDETTSTTVADTTTTSTSGETTSTSAETTTTTSVSVDATADPRCAHPGAVSADIDGDGTPDRVVHVFVEGAAVLRLCASSVGYQEIPGLGMAEQLKLVDIDEDAVFEVLYGATTAGAVGFQIAVVDEGSLSAITAQEGGPFLIQDGYPDGFPPAGSRYAYGCADRDDDGVRELVTLTAIEGPAGVEVEGRYFEIVGITAVEGGGFAVGAVSSSSSAPTIAETIVAEAPPC